jgi:hypothetical protein
MFLQEFQQSTEYAISLISSPSGLHPKEAKQVYESMDRVITVLNDLQKHQNTQKRH